MQDIKDKICDYALEEIMGERFGDYSKSIIQERALPDVRDGLKPVQRRILYGMYRNHNTFDKPHKKSATAVGDVMGKYHPHGDSSIYEAMIRMSQWWKQNTVYIDVQGNNGSMDGDGPAAMRYTEARLAKISNELLKDIDKNTVDFAPNFDDTLWEPVVLPAKFPCLLVNGTTGISAGYATNIPPHNLKEIIDATVWRIDNPDGTLDQVLEIVKGPDFPTGGIIEGKKGLIDAYTTGRGKIVVRCKYEIVKEKGKKQILITEIPFDVNKSNMVRKIGDIIIDKKVAGISDVRDESNRKEPVRVAIDLKKDADCDLVLNYLLKNTDMQISYAFNMVAIVNRRPMTLGILPILDAYIKHQKEVIIKRTTFDLEVAKKRMHIVEGLIKALSILDEVIACIRKSKNRSDSINNLVESFAFTFEQAKAIVDLQLYRLSNTDVETLKEEYKNLKIIIEGLEAILKSEENLKQLMKDELNKIALDYGTDRKTVIKDEITEIKIDTESMIPKEDVMVTVSKEGYIKRTSLRSYDENVDTQLKDSDYLIGIFKVNTLDTILLFTDLGNYLSIKVHELPDLKWKELGKHISNLIPIKALENIVFAMPVYDFDSNKHITIFTKNGMVKRTILADFKTQRTSKPMVSIKLKENDSVVSVTDREDKYTFLVTKNGYGLTYLTEEIPVTGLKTSGVKSITLKDDSVVSGILYNDDYEYLTIVTDKNTSKRIKLTEFEKTTRARRGVQVIRDVKTNPYHILKAFIISFKDQILIKTSKEIKVLKLTEIPINDRYATGSNISKQKILDCLKYPKILEKEQVEVIEKENISIEDIDKKMLTIDDFLKEMEK